MSEESEAGTESQQPGKEQGGGCSLNRLAQSTAGWGGVDSESEAESMVTVGCESEEKQVKEKEKAKGGSAKRTADNGRAESAAGGKKQRPGVRERWNLMGPLSDSEGAAESPEYGDSSPNDFPFESPLFTGGSPLGDPGGEERMDA